jgi:hypothetical protein
MYIVGYCYSVLCGLINKVLSVNYKYERGYNQSFPKLLTRQRPSLNVFISCKSSVDCILKLVIVVLRREKNESC